MLKRARESFRRGVGVVSRESGSARHISRFAAHMARLDCPGAPGQPCCGPAPGERESGRSGTGAGWARREKAAGAICPGSDGRAAARRAWRGQAGQDALPGERERSHRTQKEREQASPVRARSTRAKLATGSRGALRRAGLVPERKRKRRSKPRQERKDPIEKT